MNNNLPNITKALQERQIVCSDNEIVSGAPVFAGTRVPLQTFFDYSENEAGIAEFLDDFPHLRTLVFRILALERNKR